MMGQQTMKVKRTLLLPTAVVAVLTASLLALGTMAKPAEAAFPGDNGKITFTSDRDGNSEVYVMNQDDSGTPTNLTNEAASDHSPTVSPDGTKIAFATARHGDNEIYVMNADGSGTPTRLTNSLQHDVDPAFSPDGSKIAFRSSRDGNEEVYVMSAKDEDNDGNGDSPTNLTNNPAFDAHPAFSPDGTKIAFTSARDGNLEVHSVNSDGTGTPVNLTNNSSAVDSEPNFSPDGTKIAFTTSRHGGPDVYVMKAADGSGQSRLTNTPAIDEQPAFSPDGTKIAFTSKRDGNKEIYSMSAEYADNDANGDNPTRLTNNSSAADDFPDWGSGLLADTTPPTVKGLVATNRSSTGVPLRKTNFKATFSEKMDTTILNKSTFKLFKCPTTTSTKCTTQVTNVTVTPSADGLSATLNPFGKSSTLLAKNTRYKAVVTTGAEDLAGNSLGTIKVSYFKTGSS